MSRELETVTLWRDGGGGLWLGRSGPERPWNWLTGTVAYRDASGARPQMDAGYDETGPRQRAMHTEAVGRFIPIANCHIRVWLPLAGFGPNR